MGGRESAPDPQVWGLFVTLMNDLVRPWMMVWVGSGSPSWRSDARRKWALLLMFVVPLPASLDDAKVELVHRARGSGSGHHRDDWSPRTAGILAAALWGCGARGRALGALLQRGTGRHAPAVPQWGGSSLPEPGHHAGGRACTAEDVRRKEHHQRRGGSGSDPRSDPAGGWGAAPARALLRGPVLGLGVQVRGRDAQAGRPRGERSTSTCWSTTRPNSMRRTSTTWCIWATTGWSPGPRSRVPAPRTAQGAH